MFLLFCSIFYNFYKSRKVHESLGEVLEGVYDPLARVTTRAEILIHDGAVTHKSGRSYANWG